jgi:hypothetical protein
MLSKNIISFVMPSYILNDVYILKELDFLQKNSQMFSAATATTLNL